MSSNSIATPQVSDTLSYYGWWYNLYLNGGRTIQTVPIRKFQVTSTTQKTLAQLISRFDIITTDFGGRGNDKYQAKQTEQARILSVNLLLLADFIKALESSSPDEFKALREVGVITMIAVELWEGEKCHNSVAHDLLEALKRASSKPETDNLMAKYRKPIKFKKKGGLVNDKIIAQFKKPKDEKTL